HYYRRTEAPSANNAPAANASPNATNPVPAAQTATQTAAAPDKLNITVKANSDVWLRVLVDGETSKDRQGGIWQAGRSQEFTPQEKLTLNYPKTLSTALEVTANGNHLRVPTDTKGRVSQEWIITKDNYKQFLP
ncbi:MAG: hypothetical protein LC754_11625, partial [Acidobacteria bacterium]|nr:hypothetical protein [Acidobacteriota bacterium]